MELIGVSKDYVSKKRVSTKAVNNVSYNFPSRGMVFILGKSGCGKTTLMNILGGIETPSEGEVLYLGNKLDVSQRKLDAFRANEVSFVFQSYNLINDLTVYENLRLANSSVDKMSFNNNLNHLLQIVKLNNDVLNKYPTELSGGQQQRIALVRAFLKPHNVILADEPTGNLDSLSSKDIFELLKRASKNKLVIVVTHDQASASQYADEIITMQDGRLLNRPKTINQVKKQIDFSQKNVMSPKTVLKLALINFKKKFFMVFLALLLCIMAVSTFSFARAIGNFDVIKNTLSSFKKNNVTSCIINTENPQANLDLLKDGFNNKNAKYFNCVNYSAPINNDLHNNKFEGYYIRYNDIKYVPINGKNDVELLFGKQDLDFNNWEGVYITDIYSELLVGESYSTDKVNNIEITLPEEIIGNYLVCSRKSYLKILGFIKTDFYNHYNKAEPLTPEYEKFRFNINYKYFNLYGSEDYLKENYQYEDGLSFYNDNGNKIEIVLGDDNINVDALSTHTTVINNIIYDNKYVKNLDLKSNEILINLTLYNQIFETDYTAIDIYNHDTNTVLKELELPKLVDLKFVYKNNYYSFDKMKIIGVSFDRADFKPAIYLSHKLIEPFKFINNETRFLLVENLNNIELEEIMNMKSFNVDAPYTNEVNNYGSKAFELFESYLGYSLILMIFFLILMYYIINNIINANIKNIGILRSLGISKSQCLSVYILFSIIFAFFVIVVSSIVVPIAVQIMNTKLALPKLAGMVLLRYDLFMILGIGLLPLVVAILSSILPLTKLNRMKPIDIINRG